MIQSSNQMQEGRKFQILMDQDEPTKEDCQSDYFSEITKFLEEVQKQSITYQQIENKIIVFLLGNSRVGKSTIYHLLQGDKLINDQKYKKRLTLFDTLKKNLIGQDGLSFTKVMNFFTTSGVIIVDTPGFNDINEGYDEVIQQLNMARLLNRCRKENCKEILFLVLAKFDEDNYNELKQTFKRISENFPENLLPLYLQKIRFIITKSSSDQEEMAQVMDDIFSKILTQNLNAKTNQIIEYFLTHRNQIFYFPQSATEEEQLALYNQINDFIRSSNYQAQGYTQIQNSVLEHQFSLAISDSGYVIMSRFLSKVQKFYEIELSAVYDQLIERINLVKDVELKFKICKEFQNIQQDPLYFESVCKFLIKLYQVNGRYSFAKLPLERIQKTDPLFKDGWMDIIFTFQSQQKYFDISRIIQMAPSYQKIMDLSIEISRELENKFKSLNENHELLFKQMRKITKILSEKQNYESMSVFIGNRQSGKSTAVGLLFPNINPKFITYKPTELKDINNQINPDFVIMGEQDSKIIIEFQEFLEESLSFLQYLYQNSIDLGNTFKIYLVLNENLTKYPQDFQVLEKFIKINNFNCQQCMTIIANCIENSVFSIQNFLPSYLNIYIQQITVIRMFLQSETITLESGFENIQQTKYILPKSQLKNIGEGWLQSRKKGLFYLLTQSIDKQKLQKWNQTNQVKDYQMIIELSFLLPSTNNFETKFKELKNYFQLNIQMSENQNRYDLLQEMHKQLIIEKNILQAVDLSLSFIETVKKQLEVLSLQLAIVDEPNLRLDVKVIRKINEIFPIIFHNQPEVLEEIEFLRALSHKLYGKPQYNPSFEWKQINIIKDKLNKIFQKNIIAYPQYGNC